MVTTAADAPRSTASSGELIVTEKVSSPSRILSFINITSEHPVISGGEITMDTSSIEKSTPPAGIAEHTIKLGQNFIKMTLPVAVPSGIGVTTIFITFSTLVMLRKAQIRAIAVRSCAKISL